MWLLPFLLVLFVAFLWLQKLPAAQRQQTRKHWQQRKALFLAQTEQDDQVS